MKIFVCEYVTGGGLYRAPLPPSLLHEGDAMLRSLLGDLSELEHAVLITTRDRRLPALPDSVEVYWVDSGEDIWWRWEQCIVQADAVWPIAPEYDGILERISALVIHHGKRLLGCAPQAVALAASKHATSVALSAAGITTVPTFRPADIPRAGKGPWVVKPDDGAGCEDTRYFSDDVAMRDWLAQDERMHTHIVQPYLSGVPASLSMLSQAGKTWLLSCNRQLVDLSKEQFHYRGSIVNGMVRHWEQFERLACAVGEAIPGLEGFVGIDLMVEEGKPPCVLEINPRLTTSYVGLARAIGCNPARLVEELLYNGAFTISPVIARNIVEVRLYE